MCLLAQDRTWVSWLGAHCSLMERFHSWSRCVYNYTLGNRILSVYKRRMFWQPLWILWKFPEEATVAPFFVVTPGNHQSPGHQPCVPSPSGSWIWSSRQRCPVDLYHRCLFWKTATAPVNVTAPSLLSVCSGGSRQPTAGVLQKLNESSRGAWAWPRPPTQLAHHYSRS